MTAPVLPRDTGTAEGSASPAAALPQETIGIFGGSFNPVHNGHIAVARAAVSSGLVGKVLMVLSPLNPLKEHPEQLVADADRLAMLRRACAPYPELEACDVELSMPRPSYTVDTMHRLRGIYPTARLRLIIGADNLACFDRWRAWEELLRDYAPVVYPREGYPLPANAAEHGFTPLDAPLFPVSSTEIRAMIAAGTSTGSLIPDEVASYIRSHALYGAGSTPPTPSGK